MSIASRTPLLAAALAVLPGALVGQEPSLPVPPPSADPRIYQIVAAASPERIEADIRTLAGFGTRNTFSDTLSNTRGIGAARRWIYAEFQRISQACGGCLEVRYVSHIQEQGAPRPTNVVNVIAIQRGTTHPNRYVIMSGDIDSRNSNTRDGEGDAPGANDNASGTAGVLEAARLLTKYTFGSSIVYATLSGEEQGLWGGTHLVEVAKQEGWDIIGVLNNDMIGNIAGIDGVIENTVFRVFSEGPTARLTDQELNRMRLYGGEVDGPSRQLARYVAKMTAQYIPNLEAMMIYRLDRFGRGGHHRPFNDAGFPGVRIMEAHEHYDRQHQNLRTENGRHFGDEVDFVNFDYAAKLAAVNAITMAGLAWAPPQPDSVRIGGAVSPHTTLAWNPVSDPNLAGYRIYWRRTTAPQWEHSIFVGNVNEYTLENIVIDNWFFGVASVGRDGNESVVVFPTSVMRRR
ncbi:MAG TPA: M28 family peptidase [Gemmatimonadaceae bacterium]